MSEAEYNLNQLHFVNLWNDDSITTIEEFITKASDNPHITFKRTSTGDGSDADKKALSADISTVRSCATRYTFGSGSGVADKRKIKDASFPFDERFRTWEERRTGEWKWHVRRLPKSTQYETATKETGSAAFDRLFPDYVFRWK